VVEIEVTTAQPGFVVLNDIWHPWWQAELDGQQVDILKANVLFRAVQVPAGTHKIRFSFHPLDGAIAELRDRVTPPEEEGVVAEAPTHSGPSGSPATRIQPVPPEPISRPAHDMAAHDMLPPSSATSVLR
jgi:hypothetical protein